jgi:hypothetical protein
VNFVDIPQIEYAFDLEVKPRSNGCPVGSVFFRHFSSKCAIASETTV